MEGGRGSGPPRRGGEVLDVKPLRTLTPMFPANLGFTAAPGPAGSPAFICVTPFAAPDQPGKPGGPTSNGTAARVVGYPDASSSAFRTPPMIVPLNEDSGMCEQRTSSSGRKLRKPKQFTGYSLDSPDSDGRAKKKPRPKYSKPKGLLVLPSSMDDPRETVETVLMTFDALRRRLMQVDEGRNVSRRPDLKAGSIMMDSDLRLHKGKVLGDSPGVNIGDIFYFRFEMCLIGLHPPSMAGIDYISTKIDNENDVVAASIVSSGGYEDESGDADVLVYTGQGGSKTSDSRKQIDDQKLERGNLALERSLHRGNQIRVIRAAKDLAVLNGKIYYYDGLYKIHESWADKTRNGFNVFKYKLLREPGQPDGFAIWKMTEKWRENPSSRGRVILPDMSSGEEVLPVCLVNEVDLEKGPEHFTYSTKVTYLRPISSMKSLRGCSCQNVCLPGDANCTCAQWNGGDLPYSSTGLLVSRKRRIYECSSMCRCSINCRNRVTQKGTRLRFEVFRTTNRGWGLRSWDPIRAGAFICEYTGEVVDKIENGYDGEEDDYIFDTTRIDDKPFRWNYIPELLGEPSHDDSEGAMEPFPIVISAKRVGNIARFMNHSCTPNVFWQAVLHDHGDEDYPHIMFFAMKHIPPMTELAYDYGCSGCRQKKCLCGSTKCRGFFG